VAGGFRWSVPLVAFRCSRRLLLWLRFLLVVPVLLVFFVWVAAVLRRAGSRVWCCRHRLCLACALALFVPAGPSVVAGPPRAGVPACVCAALCCRPGVSRLAVPGRLPRALLPFARLGVPGSWFRWPFGRRALWFFLGRPCPSFPGGASVLAGGAGRACCSCRLCAGLRPGAGLGFFGGGRPPRFSSSLACRPSCRSFFLFCGVTTLFVPVGGTVMISWSPGPARFFAGRRSVFFRAAVPSVAARRCGSGPLRCARRRPGAGSSRLPRRAGGGWYYLWREGVNSGSLASSPAYLFLFFAGVTTTPPILTRARMLFFFSSPVFRSFSSRVFPVFYARFFSLARVLVPCCAGVFFFFGARPVAVPMAANPC
jgi:hypothetical protein